MIHRPDSSLRTVVDADLAKQALNVNLYGCLGDVERACNVLVRSALHQVREDHPFPDRQSPEIIGLRDVTVRLWMATI